MLVSSLVFASFAFGGVSALPMRSQRRATAVSATTVDSLVPFGQFARVAYCDPSKIKGWQCGQACDALPGFNATLIGGDGNTLQNYFVGFWPDGNTVVVSHEGTDPIAIQSDLTDAKILKGTLDSKLFPNAPSGIEVHTGFRDQHAKTANAIFAEVRKLLASTGATSVTTVGHSLGGALSILEALSLRLRLPKDVSVTTRTFGAPRVGDSSFAQFFNSKVSDIQRVNNKQDLVPIIPGEFLGFQHPKGEVHILDDGTVVACDGSDNSSDDQCSDASVATILMGSIANHLGPYFNQQDLSMGTVFCT